MAMTMTMAMAMALPKGVTGTRNGSTIRCPSMSGRAGTTLKPTSTATLKPTLKPRSSPVQLLFVLLVMIAFFADNFSAVVAFHQSSSSHQNNNPNSRRRQQQQQQQQQQQHEQQQQQQQQQQHEHELDPIRPRTVEHEPHSTDFPKTSTPADDGDRKSKMFSPMDKGKKSNSSAFNNYHNHGGSSSSNSSTKRPKVVKSIWETSAPVLLEASSLRTFDFEQPSVERVQVLLKKADVFDPVSGKRRAAGEPLIARVDLWHGPDSTPQNLAIYLEEEDEEDCSSKGGSSGNGSTSGSGCTSTGTSTHSDTDDTEDAHAEDMHTCTRTPFSTIIETPQGHNTIAIRNIAESSDLLACVEGEESELLANENGWYTPSAPPPTSNSNINSNINSNTKNDSPLQSVIQRLQATTTPQRIDSTTANHDHHHHHHQHDQDFHDQDDDGVNDDDDDDEGNKAVVGSCAVELPSNIASVQVLLQTQFMQPLQARIELELRMMEDGSGSSSSGSSSSSSGTNYRVVKRTIVEVYSEDGMHRPFFAVLEAPRKAKKKLQSGQRRGQGGTSGSNASANANAERGWFGGSGNGSGNGNSNNGASYCTSMRVVNLSTTEFPLFATVEPHTIDPSLEDDEGENDDDDDDDRKGQAATAATTTSDDDDNDDDDENDQQQWTAHFGGGSSYDMISNSTILDAEIL
eukprot:CAMPEP_0168230644 /NCGR_PEP_ID=MMETSP0140_2-20121125/16112_1 /TAXON_ID=44445 /ORGANISM="Pseudo-nitzschia australis, Strain 10249 10 AB" /LENGTH=686 /DNA_ID=CAMNT_0008162923 /DNA_START=120 /DNA_END=2180 /DNA_ORIENTATION=+